MLILNQVGWFNYKMNINEFPRGSLPHGTFQGASSAKNFSVTFGFTMALIHTAGLALASCSAIIYTWPAFFRR